MKKYTVTGMTCAACSARVEKAVSKVDGVTEVSVNLLTNTMTVDGTADDIAIISAVHDAGYGTTDDTEKTKDTETSTLKKRLYPSLVFLLILMYFSMGHTMWNLPLPDFFNSNHVAVGLVQLLLTTAVMVINQKFFINGFKGLINRSPNMDTLVATGAGAAFVYSTYSLFAMTTDSRFIHELYFESAAMILTLITVGKMLEARSKGKTTNALKSLMNLAPKTAVILKDGKETAIPASQVAVGDIFIVKSGGSIPADGVITEGHCSVDESSLTGESIPVDKSVGDKVSAATISRFGYIKCRAVKVGEDTALAQIIKTVSDAAASKAPIAKVADKVSGVFVPIVISIALATAVIWLVLGESAGFALARGISVLVISCPCALGLATPVAIMVGSGVGAKKGILFKTAESLEETGKVKIVALDKTGTVTKGTPSVTDILPADGITKDELLSFACALEAKSEHPLASAILRHGRTLNINPSPADEFEVLPGMGICGRLDGKKAIAGNVQFASPGEKFTKLADNLADNGKTPLIFKHEDRVMGIIALADEIKDDSPKAVAELKAMGIQVVMLTGDNEKTAKAVQKKCGIDEVIAGVLPGEKEKVIKSLKTRGKTAMVGDGINDAPALTSADTGIAIGSGTDIAIDSADVVLMNSRLSDVPDAIRLSRAVLKNIHENLFWAFIYNTVGIPLAAGVFIPLGLKLNPMFGAAAMSLSSFCVVTNALRLNKQQSKNKKIKKEIQTMTTEIKIEGMMCMHCSGRVKTALEAMEGVESAVVSHETNNAIVTLTKDIPFDELKKTVEAQGYKVIE